MVDEKKDEGAAVENKEEVLADGVKAAAFEDVKEKSGKEEEEPKKAESADVVDESDSEELSGEGLTKGEKMLSAIGYIQFFCILPLVLKPNSEFCQLHGKQGLVLTICFLVFSIFAFVHSFVALVVGLLYLVFVILGIANSVQGKFWKIPVIYSMSRRLVFE